jgi:hypothetical protein
MDVIADVEALITSLQSAGITVHYDVATTGETYLCLFRNTVN